MDVVGELAAAAAAAAAVVVVAAGVAVAAAVAVAAVEALVFPQLLRFQVEAVARCLRFKTLHLKILESS
jgi:hypothetical protein